MQGIVVCVHHDAAEEGVKVLEAGGNAFDAAIATAFVQMVLLPFSCGVGGMVSAQVFSAKTNEHQMIDGGLRAGSLVTEDMWAKDYLGEAMGVGNSLFEDLRSDLGYTSICTPGAVAALSEIHRRFCTIPWRELIGPAIRISEDGFTFTPYFNNSMRTPSASRYQPDWSTRLQATEACRDLYIGADGSILEDGHIIQNADHAETLKRLASAGADDFYRGDLSEIMANDLAANGSFVTKEDFREFKINIYVPRSVNYGDYSIFSNAAPGGGPLLQQELNILHGLNLRDLEHNEMKYMNYVASTLQLVNQERIELLGDPDFIGEEPMNKLLSQDRARVLRDLVLSGHSGARQPPTEGPDTTHLNVVDEDGNIVSITHTLGNSSGVVTPGLGFVYNNGMGRYDPRPGRASSMAPRKSRLNLTMPSMVFKEERPVMVFGAPGGNGILSALTQVFTNVVDFGMTAVEAVSAPRIHAEGQMVICEGRVSTDVCESLTEQGHNVIYDQDPFSRKMALVQLAALDSSGEWCGASDPRGPMGMLRTR